VAGKRKKHNERTNAMKNIKNIGLILLLLSKITLCQILHINWYSQFTTWPNANIKDSKLVVSQTILRNVNNNWEMKVSDLWIKMKILRSDTTCIILEQPVYFVGIRTITFFLYSNSAIWTEPGLAELNEKVKPPIFVQSIFGKIE
jgi:hypothetical protein